MLAYDYLKDKHFIKCNALDWVQIRGQLPSRLEYFPDDYGQTLTYMEIPYYRYEFERKKRGLEAKRWPDAWLNEEVGYRSIRHDSRGNLVDGLGNPIKEVEEVVEEEEGQERDRNYIPNKIDKNYNS